MNEWERHKKRLYHSYKNENALPYVIIGSILLLFCKGGIPCIIALWLWYASYCSKNNEALNNDPEILRDREICKKLDEKKNM